MTLPRRLSLDEFGELKMRPVEAVRGLRGEHASVGGRTIAANRDELLPGLGGDAAEIRATIAPSSASMVALDVLVSPDREEFTRIAFFRDRGYSDNVLRKRPRGSLVTLDTSCSSTAADVRSRAPETASVRIAPDEPLELTVFVDRSVVEVFVNDRQCVAARVYPERDDSTGISLRSQGCDTELASLDVWQMQSIYPSG